MKIVFILSSLRTNSSSETLAKFAFEGAKSNGNEVEILSLRNMDLNFCKGCLACQVTGKCIIKDDVNGILDIVSNADILVFTTPIYYYSISGQLKTFLDRLNPLFIRNNKFKKIYTMFTCADDQVSAIEGPLKAVEGWIDCFEGVEFVKSFNGLAINSIEDVTDEIKKRAYEFGKGII